MPDTKPVRPIEVSGCTRTHWGITDCPECGLKSEYQANATHVAAPTRQAEVELPPLDSLYFKVREERERAGNNDSELLHYDQRCSRERQLKAALAENVRLKAWKAEAMVAMRENEEWRGKLNDKACEFGYAGRHYLEAACEIADRLKAALARIAQLQSELDTCRR